jgi:hypothetical protein
VLITEPPRAPERTWRPPLEVRVARVLCAGIIVSLPAAYLALTLWTNQVQHAVWIALALGLAAWGWLAGRALAQSLTLTSQHGTFAPERSTVGTAILGSAYWSGRRASADTMADAINDTAGLPHLPPRREIISPRRAWLLLVTAAAIFGIGVYLGPLPGIQLHHHSPAVGAVGGFLYGGGITALAFAYRLTRDHRCKRLSPG